MNKILFLVATIILPTIGFAADVSLGRVVEAKGSSFISYNGRTKELKKGDAIYPQSEILVETSGQVTFTDNADHRFHLSSSSSAMIDAEAIELRSGEIWVQSINRNDEYKLKSANALVTYQGGEGIFSYDNSKGKSQLLVINGMMKLSNLRDQELNLHVGEGHFSFITPEFEGGNPRVPTSVGEKTFKEMISIYAGINPLDNKSFDIFKENDFKIVNKNTHKTQRSIASVSEVAVDTTKVEATAKTLNKEVINVAKKTYNKATFSKVEINFYGNKNNDIIHTTSVYDNDRAQRTRMPASAVEAEVEDLGTTVNALDKTNDIYENNPIIQHYRESDTLIQKLKGL